MSVKLYFDPGHGGRDPGGTGNGMLEKDFVLRIVLRMKELMDEYEDVEVRLSRSDDRTVSLKKRVTDANNWGADYFISVHMNAFDGTARGYEDFIYRGIKGVTAQWRNVMHNAVYGALDNMGNIANRGKKESGFYVLRRTKMPAILTESLFLDSNHDAKIIRRDDFIEKVAQGHVKGLVEIFDLKKKPRQSHNGVFYRVVTGSFSEFDNAEKRMEDLKNSGFDSFIDVFKK